MMNKNKILIATLGVMLTLAGCGHKQVNSEVEAARELHAALGAYLQGRAPNGFTK